jgi:DNA-directed RNA polymerase subunit RPC12/RpoP
MARTATPRTIRCYLCGHTFEVAARTMTTSCPGCSKALKVEDVVVKTIEAVRKIQTCGRVVVQKSGRVFAQAVEAQEGVDVEGVLEANVVSGGPVRIGPKATWKGDCRAPSLRVELGGTIVGGYFVIPAAADGATNGQ